MFKSTIFLTIAAALFVNAAPLDRRTLFVCAIDPQPIETDKPVIIARSPIVLPPGSKPIDSDPNLPVHAFKRCTILPEALPIETEPETEKPVIIARSPIVLPPGSRPIDIQPGFPVNILARSPIVLSQGSKPLINYNPDFPVNILRRSPAFLPPGSEPPYDPDTPMHILEADLPA